MYSFTFDSEKFTTDECCNTITVEISVDARDPDDAPTFEIESIFDETANVERKYEDFSQEEQSKIDKLAEELAYENAYDAYQSYLESEGDRLYDAWKDSQMEGE